VRLVPGAIIPVASNGGARGPSLQALQFPGSLQLSEAIRQDLKTTIRQMLFDNPLPPEVQTGLTATEVIERVRQFQADTGAFGRLQSDAVVPIIRRCVDILEEAGELADPRFAGMLDALQDDAVRVRPTSPLAQAQDRADVQAIMQFLTAAANMGDLSAALVKSGISIERAGRYIAERQGVPHALIPTEDELRQQAAAAQQQQTEQQVMTSPVAGAVANAAVTPAEREPMR
jgi:hypothetical protein